MIEGEEEEAGAGRKEEQEHIFSEIVKVLDKFRMHKNS